MDLEDEKYLVSTAMIKHGGSFVKSLGEALTHADKSNTLKIKSTWPEYWQKYNLKSCIDCGNPANKSTNPILCNTCFYARKRTNEDGVE